MLDILRRTWLLWWRTWPWLVAIYFVGWLLRFGAYWLAIYVGVHVGGFWGNLLLPLSVFIRVCVYVAMFGVLGREVLRQWGVDESSEAGRLLDLRRFAPAVVPVLTLLVVWRLPAGDAENFRSDLVEMTVNSTVGQFAAEDRLRPYMLPTDWRVYVAIAAVFACRLLLTRLKNYLPAWTQVIAAYLEVTWIVLLVFASADKLFGTPEWISERRVVVWYSERRSEVFSYFPDFSKWYGVLTDNVGPIISAVLIALTWIAIAGVVIQSGNNAVPTWTTASRRLMGARLADQAARVREEVTEKARSRWLRLPQMIQLRGVEFGRSLLGVLEKLGATIRLTMHAGALNLACYVALFTGIVLLFPNDTYYNAIVSDGLMWRWVATVIGPHDWLFWESYDTFIRGAIGVVIDPIRICLIVAMYWYCLDRVAASPDVEAYGAKVLDAVK